jgi:hypothetical protein
MAHTAHLVCLIRTLKSHRKNALGRGSTSSGHIAKLDKSTFLDICGMRWQCDELRIYQAM